MTDKFNMSFSKYIFFEYSTRKEYIFIPSDNDGYFEYDLNSNNLKIISNDNTYYSNTYVSLAGISNLWNKKITSENGYVKSTWFGYSLSGVTLYTNMNITVYSNGTIRFYNDNLKEKF